MTIGALAERLLIAPHSATELVERLVAVGYVSRTADLTDRRRQTLALTEKADGVLKRLTKTHIAEIKEPGTTAVRHPSRFAA
jgi:DNA-binding MarR family transcriptional regulator